MKTTVMLIRHGEAEGNFVRKFHGFFNSRLTEKGYMQINRLAERLKNEHIDFLYSSDLDRAFETAKAVNKYHNLDIIKDEAFREIHGGKWEDTPWDDLPVLFPEIYGNWLNSPIDTEMPDGETMREFNERLIEGVHKLIKRHEGKTICIASHGTAIRSLVCYFLNVPFSELDSVEWCDNAALTVAEYENGKFNVTINGENAHLKDISTIEGQAWFIDRQNEKGRK